MTEAPFGNWFIGRASPPFLGGMMTQLQKTIALCNLRAATRDLRQAFLADPEPDLIPIMSALGTYIAHVEGQQTVPEPRRLTPRLPTYRG